jgi:hypothetical protein
LLDIRTRDLDNIGSRDPALTLLQVFNDLKRHWHAEIGLDQSLFQFFPIDFSAAESLDQVLEKSDRHHFRILEKLNWLQIAALVGPDLRAGRFRAGSSVLDGRLGDPPLPRLLQSYLRHPKFFARVTEPQVFVNTR